VPVIVVTANTEIDHVFVARDTGMSEYLAKPVSAKLIYPRICSTIESTRPFVRAGGFFGPDRRRRRATFQGTDRRVNDLQVRNG
jgi:two-component system chemotaxis response regulator CheY